MNKKIRLNFRVGNWIPVSRVLLTGILLFCCVKDIPFFSVVRCNNRVNTQKYEFLRCDVSSQEAAMGIAVLFTAMHELRSFHALNYHRKNSYFNP